MVPKGSKKKDLDYISNFHKTLISLKFKDFAQFRFEMGSVCTSERKRFTKKVSISYNTRRYSGVLKS